MAEVRLEAVSRVYGPQARALDRVDLRVRDGEFLVLLGPSGCGKTTALRIMAGLDRPDEGEVYLDGVCVTARQPQERNVAMVFQNYALYAHMTVYKNIAFPLRMRGLPRDEIDRRVQAAAELLDIVHLLNRRPRALSGGQRQRVALGRAMVRDPAVFLLDEPLSNLDARMRAELRAEIVRLHRALGATFVYVTHDQHEALAMGDRIAVMREGRVLQIDPPQRVYDHPATRFVAEFVGTPRMNLLPGTLVRRAGRAVLCMAGVELPLPERRLAALPPGEDECGVVAGIRPEDLHEDQHGVERPLPLRVRVEEVEPMGGETHVRCTAGGEALTAALPNRTALRRGQEVELVADAARLHLFDETSGENLLTGEGE